MKRFLSCFKHHLCRYRKSESAPNHKASSLPGAQGFEGDLLSEKRHVKVQRLRFLYPDYFSLKTAWRDARSQYRLLLLYCGGIVAGVAALVAILSFRNDVMLTVNEQARELLGADLEISRNEPYDAPLIAWIDSVGGDQSRGLEFSSMVIYPASSEDPISAAHGSTSPYGMEQQVTRLSQIRAISGNFPFYGSIVTEPAEAAYTYQTQGTALVDRPVMNELGMQIGDSIRIGERWYSVSGMILEIPGQSAAFSLIGPRIIVPLEHIEGSELLNRGSRVQYLTWFGFDPKREDLKNEDDMARLAAEVRSLSPDRRTRVTTVRSRQDDFAAIVEQMTRFLGMVGFIALILGAIGVAGALYVYIKKKSSMIALLRCLGLSSRQSVWIFGLQIAGIGFTGAIAGVLAGIFIQHLLPQVFSDLLPFELTQRISLPVLAAGLLTGTGISLLMALLPLASILSVPPLLSLRTVDFSPFTNTSRQIKIITGLLVLLLLTFMLYVVLQNLQATLWFVVLIVISILLLLGISLLLVHLAGVLRLQTLSYIWRQGTSNLYRPNNQTVALVTILGMGMLIMGSLYLSQEMILERIRFQTGDQQPNLVFYDIQYDQNEAIASLAVEQGALVLDNVPIISMRLAAIEGRSVQELRFDSTSQASSWALTREYRVTYREELNDAEKIREGSWTGRVQHYTYETAVPVSLDYRLADDLGVSLGSRLSFDIQGIRIETEVTSIREVDFQRPQPNFFVLFPAGILEEAPRFYAMTMHSPDEETTARLQRMVVRSHPNVSAIDVGLILESVRTFLDKIALAVRFMALFSILTGLIVLASSIGISRMQRVREAVLLRTLGASRGKIRGIQVVEFLWIGSLACLSGFILAYGVSWGLARWYFDLVFVPDFSFLILLSVIIIALTILVGLLSTRDLLKRKPLEVLRSVAD